MKIFKRMLACVMAATITITFIQSDGFGSALTDSVYSNGLNSTVSGTKIVTTENKVASSNQSGARFADSINLDKEAERASFVPITSIKQLIDEIKAEKKMSKEQLKTKKAYEKLIGTIGVVNVSRALNVRDDADGDANIVGKLYQNSAITIRNFAGEDNEWIYVESGSVRGWVVAKYIEVGKKAASLYEAMKPRVATLVCDAKAYNFLGKGATLAAEIKKGRHFPVINVQGDYVRVQLTASNDGFIHNEFVSLNDGLNSGVKLSEEEDIQDEIDLNQETRRLILEEKKAAAQAAAEAAKQAAAKKAARQAEAKRKASSSSSSKNSGKSSSSSGNSLKKKKSSDGGKGWTYLGNFRVTFYCVNCNSPRGSRSTASGKKAKEGVTCSVKSSQIPLGTEVKVEGFGTWIAQDTGVGRNQIDLFVYPNECDGLYHRDVWVKW